MQQRKIGPFTVAPVALGCMNISHLYGPPLDRKEASALLNAALDQGYNHLDTAAAYGYGANEELIGELLDHRRDEFLLASKAGLFKDSAGKREIDGRPEVLKRTCEIALKRLKREAIDLYYLHRWDKSVPIEDSVGALADLVREGKVRTLGLSEVSAASLRKAHAVHPIAAVQSEYALWTRNPELGVLEACRELGVAFVAFSPLGRGFLAGAVRDTGGFPEGDIRRSLPRFAPENLTANLALLQELDAIAGEVGCSPAQLSLAWVLARGPHVIALPGTRSLAHLKENKEAEALDLDEAVVARLDRLINQDTVTGTRYVARVQLEIDTEEFSA